MIASVIIFITFACIIGLILYHYIKKGWYIVKSIKYMKLQKMLMELQAKNKMEEPQVNPQSSDKNDPMFS